MSVHYLGGDNTHSWHFTNIFTGKWMDITLVPVKTKKAMFRCKGFLDNWCIEKYLLGHDDPINIVDNKVGYRNFLLNTC